MSDKMDLKASGSISVAGGEYGEVKTSASLKVNGSLKCDLLKCSGSAKIAGDLECGGKISCSGSVGVEGNLRAAEADISGSISVGGSLNSTEYFAASGSVKVGQDLSVKEAKISGSCSVSGQIRAGELRVSGSLRAQSVEAERLISTGGLNIAGLVNAEEMEIRVSGTSRIGDQGGSTIRVLEHDQATNIVKVFGFEINSFGGHKNGVLTVGAVEGDEVELECTVADVVRGRSVRIGKNCRIKRVEYTDGLLVEDSARVEEQVKV